MFCAGGSEKEIKRERKSLKETFERLIMTSTSIWAAKMKIRLELKLI